MMAFITNILRCCLFQAVLISLWMDVISGFGIQLVPQDPQVGQNVTLSVTGIKGTIKSFTWYKGETADTDNQIFFNINNNIALGAQNFSRANGLPNASLHISDLMKTDQGYYTVTVQTMNKSEATILLLVYESVLKPKVTVSTPNPLKNEEFRLICNTTNAEEIWWYKDNVTLFNGVNISQGNSTINFSSLKLSDEGNYVCEARNRVSNNCSDPYNLIVHYGPVNISIEGTLNMSTNSHFSLKCAAFSVPTPKYKWSHNGSYLQQDTVSVERATLDDQGNYTCEAYNSVTNMSVVTSVYVTIYDSTQNPNEADTSAQTVGIVVAVVLLVIVLVIALIYLLVIRRRNTKTTAPNSNASASGVVENDRTTIPGIQMAEHEIQYSSLEFAGRGQRMKPDPEPTMYAEVRRT
ncbi:carcinoembryonic antigen-related cell adhesion molecule 6 isoform X1 [Bombina bombina]|uniref:carcinoembryonic antigen-related cell adhesion molecule 6 isoform X1 n=1 Tax=Bombina bombina TaxID=8345 RepID=UPI00235B264C|nr:carcinoembryonic antigen-related cell adhesion molecule 6 isoform X1 [Bombina bombina]